jgi:hypothetical protein
MKIERGILFWIFIWCIFMGITAISIGLGALFPSMNRIAKPFVCPRGRMELETQTYRPYPGTTITTLTWYCADQETGERTELGVFPMNLYSGVIYGILLFVVIVVILQIWMNRSGTQSQPGVSTSQHEDKDVVSGAAVARMNELERLRDADLISEAEYQEKRSEIIRDLYCS